MYLLTRVYMLIVLSYTVLANSENHNVSAVIVTTVAWQDPLRSNNNVAAALPAILRTPTFGQAWLYDTERSGIEKREDACQCFDPNSKSSR